MASAPSKELGEACTAHGASECRSGMCLHTGADPAEGYFCSTTCQTQAQCPSQWGCTQVHPGAQARVCIPPAEWQAHAVTPRG
ncbi:hypothetical protein [Pyxidicoccus sp. MSG2]|uniref:hypothetical protein n=1 Tax=Pyxidicoccus sp. MSG2 TaxID=2996790 RepID=UPI00226E124B|nr:hypothetical protein [Pyxidicoccus sp. MSG2]MCY1019867.1 hypothetical protein [Pyxidicoccus sp. MSG2]